MTDQNRAEATEKAVDFFLSQYRDGNKNAATLIWELQAQDTTFADELDRVLQAMFAGKDQRVSYDGAVERAARRYLEDFYTVADIEKWCGEIDIVSGKEGLKL